MTRTKLVCLALAAALAAPLIAVPALGADHPFSVKSVLGGAPQSKTALVSVGAGEVLEFTAADLELRLDLDPGSLKGATVTALPAQACGGLYLDGVEVDAFDFLDRGELDRLCFAASEGAGSATMGLLPQAKGASAASLNIRVLEQPNHPPTAENLSLETGRNMTAIGYLEAADPDGDALQLKLTHPPAKGEVHFDGLRFAYEPYHNKTGSDSFTVCVMDVHGAYSNAATVSVHINKSKRSFYYTDMVIHQSQYAALMLHEAGVYTGKQVGSSFFFEPDDQMNRGEFLMLLVTAAGLADTMTPTVNTGLPGDESIPTHLKRYVRQAVDHGLISPTLAFHHAQIPTRAECVVMVDRASGISDVKSFNLTMADAASIPHWAQKSYQNLAAYQMLDLYDGHARPDAALTNAYAADLLWQLYKKQTAGK